MPKISEAHKEVLTELEDASALALTMLDYARMQSLLPPRHEETTLCTQSARAFDIVRDRLLDAVYEATQDKYHS